MVAVKLYKLISVILTVLNDKAVPFLNPISGSFYLHFANRQHAEELGYRSQRQYGLAVRFVKPAGKL